MQESGSCGGSSQARRPSNGFGGNVASHPLRKALPAVGDPVCSLNVAAPQRGVQTAIILARAYRKDKPKKPAGRSQNRKECYFPRLSWRTRSSWSRDIFVATNNSCLAPLESAIAFQPVRVGVVIRIFTGPFASRTLRIRPGMIVAMDEQLSSSLSRTGRNPSIIECSTLRRLLAARSLTVVAYGFDELI